MRSKTLMNAARMNAARINAASVRPRFLAFITARSYRQGFHAASAFRKFEGMVSKLCKTFHDQERAGMPRDRLTLCAAINCRRLGNGIRIALEGLFYKSGLNSRPRAGFAAPGRNRDGVQRDFLDGM